MSNRRKIYFVPRVLLGALWAFASFQVLANDDEDNGFSCTSSGEDAQVVEGRMTCTMVETGEEETQIFVLPDEVLMFVLSKLSAADLARVAKVCTRLRGLVMRESVLGLCDEREGALSIVVGEGYVSRLEGCRDDRGRALLSACNPITRPVGVDWMLRSGVDVLAFFNLALDEEDGSGLDEGEGTSRFLFEIFVNGVFDIEGRAPLHIAAQVGDARIVELLLDHGADVNVREMDLYNEREQLPGVPVPGAIRWRNQIPLMLAVRGGNLEVVRVLLKRGAQVDLVDIYGETALCWAVFNGDVAMVELLIEHGADIHVINGLGQTLEAVARGRGHHRVLEILQTVGYQDALGRIYFSTQEDTEIEVAVDDGGVPDLGGGWSSDEDGSRRDFGSSLLG